MAVRWTKRVGLGLLALVVLVAAGGLSYQAVATQIDKRSYPPPGRMVEVDGQHLHVHSTGDERGGPTVVLEAGLGSMSPQWGWVQPEVSRFARVVSYDRAGLGWSEEVEGPKDARRAAQRLHAALDEAGIEGPYVLVGHSFGGLVGRVYADTYPEEVVGMVLLDSSHPDQMERLPTEVAEEQRSVLNQMGLLPILGRLGVVRASGMLNPQAAGLPSQQRAEAVSFLSSTAHLSAMVAEAADWERTNSQARNAGDLGNMPLVVLSAGKGAMPGWQEMQAELAALSSEGEHRIVEGADHASLVTDREHSRATVEAIRETVEAAREHEQ